MRVCLDGHKNFYYIPYHEKQQIKSIKIKYVKYDKFTYITD